ncbi:sulfotransferase family protein [Saccharopolyspora sp. NPDC003752]
MPGSAQDVTFDPPALVDDALRATGGDPGELAHDPEALTELCRAVEAEAQLTPRGRVRARGSLVKALVEQVHVRRRITERPEIDAIEFQPVVITGLLRTGTTFLQNLLAHHPDLRSPALWELMAPGRVNPRSELVAECRSYIDEYYRLAPRFRSIHPLDATMPEECHRLTANTFRDSIFALRYHVPSYAEWLSRQSMVDSYDFHRTQLKCVLARDSGDPVVLKSPTHLWHLDDLAEVYPHAKLIRMHRSPAVAVASVCSLTSVVRGASSDAVDDHEIGRYWLRRVSTALDGMRSGQAPFATPPLDLRYDDLVADPIGVVAQVCDYVGVPLTAEAEQRITSYLGAGSGGGGHHYEPEQFGLDEKALDDRFSGYSNEFGLPSDK